MSKTVRAWLIGSLASILSILWIINMDSELQAQILTIITSTTTAIAWVMAIYGRIKANTTLVNKPTNNG